MMISFFFFFFHFKGLEVLNDRGPVENKPSFFVFFFFFYCFYKVCIFGIQISEFLDFRYPDVKA